MTGFFDTDRWNEIWQTISRNRRRSIMTALGVFWGIFMLIVLLGAGTGLGRMFRAQLGGTATNAIFIMSDRTSVPYEGMPTGRSWELDWDDLEALRKLPRIEYISAICWGNQRNMSHQDHKGEFGLMGYSPDMQQIAPQQILMGRYLNEVDELRQRKVCVIGLQVWRDLFPGGEDPTGKTIQIGSSYFTVVGVTKPLGGMMAFSDPERTVVIPALLVQQMYGLGRTIDMLALTGYADEPTQEVIQECRQSIAARHLIAPDDKKAIYFQDTSEVFGKIMGLFRGISLLTWIVGLGTLLAGIVGISNIMLVLVRERTQEIGIRRGFAPAAPLATPLRGLHPHSRRGYLRFRCGRRRSLHRRQFLRAGRPDGPTPARYFMADLLRYGDARAGYPRSGQPAGRHHPCDPGTADQSRGRDPRRINPETRNKRKKPT